jgi:hypothetical protein
MKNVTFPRWTAPLVGAGLGALLALRAARRERQPMAWDWLIGGATLGLVAGGLIWLLDRPAPRRKGAVAETSEAVEQPPSASAEQGSLVGRVLALLSILLFCAPFLGFVLGVAAILINSRDGGWSRTVGWIATGLSLVVTIAFVVLRLW